MDAQYIFSGSEDTNIRVWKTKADKTTSALLPREKEKLAYAEQLKKKYKHTEEVKKILRHKHLPKFITKRGKMRQIQKESKQKKLLNMQMNNRAEDIKTQPERKKDLEDMEYE